MRVAALRLLVDTRPPAMLPGALAPGRKYWTAGGARARARRGAAVGPQPAEQYVRANVAPVLAPVHARTEAGAHAHAPVREPPRPTRGGAPAAPERRIGQLSARAARVPSGASGARTARASGARWQRDWHASAEPTSDLLVSALAFPPQDRFVPHVRVGGRCRREHPW